MRLRLRGRLALSLGLLLVAQIVGLFAYDLASRKDAAARTLAHIAEHAVDDADELASCAADPAGFAAALSARAERGPGGRPRGGAGARTGAGHHLDPPNGPHHGHPPTERGLPEGGGPPGPPPGVGPGRFGPEDRHMALRYAVLDEAAVSALPLDPLDEVEGARVVNGAALAQRIAVVLPTGLTGPCAYLRLDGGTTPGFLGAVLPADPLWVLPSVAAVVWSLLALRPTVRRVRRLRGAVAATSGLEDPAVPVEGDDEIADLAVAFNEAAARLRAVAAERAQAEQALRRHVADLTHDLLIPLTVLQGHLAAMQAAGGRSPALSSAMDEAHTIGGLVQNLALAARLDGADRPLVLGPVPLNPLLERVAARHRPIAGPRGVEVVVGLPEEALAARADLSLLEAAISNLCHNAVRYNRPGGHVALLLELAEDDPTQFEITVLDDGPGIEPALLPSLLQRGARGDSARRGEPGGQGLGLDIVQRAARLHGFSLRFDGAEGGGLRVRLRGPLRLGA